MAVRIADLVLEKISPIVAELGIEVADVEYLKKNDGMNLTVYIASPEGILISDCEKVHKLIDPILDELDPTNGDSYRLNVSSLGLDRPFKTNRDYERYLNKDIVIRFYSPFNGKKELIGKLIGVADKEVQLEVDNDVLLIKKEQIAVALPQIKI